MNPLTIFALALNRRRDVERKKQLDNESITAPIVFELRDLKDMLQKQHESRPTVRPG